MNNQINNVLSQPVYLVYQRTNRFTCTKIKNMLSTVICYVERNLNEVSYKKYGCGVDFKKKFLVYFKDF